jgi:hypothetical protein
VLNLALVQYTRNSLWVLTSTLKGRKVNYLNPYLPFMVNTYYTEGRNMSRWWPLSHPSTIREIVYRVRIYTLKSRKIKHLNITNWNVFADINFSNRQRYGNINGWLAECKVHDRLTLFPENADKTYILKSVSYSQIKIHSKSARRGGQSGQFVHLCNSYSRVIWSNRAECQKWIRFSHTQKGRLISSPLPDFVRCV